MGSYRGRRSSTSIWAPAGGSQNRRKIFLGPNKVKNVVTHVEIVKKLINSKQL
jgi:hypothetical protein